MSWLLPTAFERDRVADLQRRWPEVVPLARLLSLATRVEPLLLRNARLQFLPGSATEIESLFWFSPLIGARSSDELIVHAGAARLLADELRRDAALFARVIEFTRDHTRHWPAEERLEQDLRLDALRADHAAVEQGLRDMLKRLYDEPDEETRIRLARWSRRCLAAVSDPLRPAPAARLLGQFATCSLGASSTLATADAAPSLPDWLAARLPAAYRPARLAVELRYDAARQRPVLHFIAPRESGAAIELPTPLPANLHVASEGRVGTWHLVALDGRIELPAASGRIVLATIAGRRYELRAELPESPKPPAGTALPPLVLSHLAEDGDAAQAIADWLRQRGIAVELAAEAGGETDSAADTDLAAAGDSRRLLRLWTAAARRRWRERPDGEVPAGPRTLLLRIGETSAPPPGYGAERLLDLPADWQHDDRSADAAGVFAQLHAWLVASGDADDDQRQDDASEEVARLLAELDDPQTTPPRRLAIGDRLDEIGDPRPGVGLREFVVADDLREFVARDELGKNPTEEATSSEAEALLAELARPGTPPPRRLAIGDRLAEIGDPRRGVGLDARGLPDIDWVTIPGGEFIYQQGERRKLDSFRIARYPVTNAQYQAFIDAGGYGRETPRLWQKLKSLWQTGDWWHDLRRPKPERPLWPKGNRPRTDVSWDEAVAFCRWLSAQLGYQVRLPTEEEWERTARGRDGREYPWGSTYESGRANIDEPSSDQRVGEWNLGQTTAVGVYPHAASSEGVLDLSGNVWEWCLNESDLAGWTAGGTSGQARVLRGGSWRSTADRARGAGRGRGAPDGRDAGLGGFRLVSSAPIF